MDDKVFEEYCEDKRTSYDLSLLTKEIFERLEYKAAIRGIRLLIDREQAFDKKIYGDITSLRESIAVLIETTLYFINKGETVRIASRENQIIVFLPQNKALPYLVLQPEIVLSESKRLDRFREALDYVQNTNGTVKMSEKKSEMTISLLAN